MQPSPLSDAELVKLADLLASRLKVVRPIAVDEAEAERLTSLSGKTLKALSENGDPVGRVKIGSRTIFLLTDLEAWLRRRVEREPSA